MRHPASIRATAAEPPAVGGVCAVKGAERLAVELERRTLHGLVCEYDQALEWVDEDLRRRLRRPLFALRDLKGRWGQWSEVRREIVLSRELVHGYPWGAVREVLRHEMAHQLAGAIDGGRGTPHGEAFRQACRMLRADPAAAANYRRLDADGASRPSRRWTASGSRSANYSPWPTAPTPTKRPVPCARPASSWSATPARVIRAGGRNAT